MKSLFTPIVIFFIMCAFLVSIAGSVGAETIEVNLRNRSPDLNVTDGVGSGLLKNIIETATKRIGAKVKWIEIPF